MCLDEEGGKWPVVSRLVHALKPAPRAPPRTWISCACCYSKDKVIQCSFYFSKQAWFSDRGTLMAKVLKTSYKEQKQNQSKIVTLKLYNSSLNKVSLVCQLVKCKVLCVLQRFLIWQSHARKLGDPLRLGCRSDCMKATDLRRECLIYI